MDNIMSKITAVEYLLEQIRNNKFIGASEQIEVIYAAKQIEKRQIIDSFNKGFITDQWDKSKENKAEQYYNETFKSE